MFKIRTLLTLSAGAAIAYFLDPQQGARRRADALRKLQGEVAPQARGVARKVAETAPQITSLPDAGGDLVRRARRARPEQEAPATPEPPSSEG